MKRRIAGAQVLAVAVLCAFPGGANGAGAPAASLGHVRRVSGDEVLDVDFFTTSAANPGGSRPETDWISQKTERLWLARERILKGGARPKTQWAQSDACYQLVEILAKLTDLDAPAPPHADPTLHPIVAVGEGGRRYTAEGAAFHRAAGAPTQIKMESGASLPVPQVVEDALSALAPCWSDEAPSALSVP